MVDLFKLIGTKNFLGFTPSLTITVQATLPDAFRYSLAGFADGWKMDDTDRERWRRLGNFDETLSFDLYGKVVNREEFAGYRAQVMFNVGGGNTDQFDIFDRGVIGGGWLDEDKQFVVKMTLPCSVTKNILDMLQRYSYRETDEHHREVVRLQMEIINLRHPQEGRPNVVRSVCYFDLLRLKL